jgi:triose/dihydroxyacetone kinase / FAD-AMP lyase (cyclizing)
MRIERAWAGTLLSALNMPGCSISLLRVDDATLDLLDAPTQAHAWPGSGAVNEAIVIDVPAEPSIMASETQGESAARWRERIRGALESVANALISDEPRLTELDSLAGDGDLGASMTRAGQAILGVPTNALGSPGVALSALSAALRRAIAGSSGPFYATALMRASRRLSESDGADAKDWAMAFEEAVQAIGDLGGAKAGDRTMLDALLPAASTFKQALDAGKSAHEAWNDAVNAAHKGAEETATMTPRAGRASYLGARAIGVPDGGAVAVTIWLDALRPHIGAN